MKRFFSIFFVLTMMTLIICGCQSGEKKPNEEQIKEDLTVILQEKNEYASLVSYEIIKSLSQEEEYDITLSVMAQTDWADWEYEVDLTYILYDQGWMMENNSWKNENYEVMRTPNIEEMTEYTETYLANHELCNRTCFGDYLISMQDFSITDNENTLTFGWLAKDNYLHYATFYDVKTVWEYSPDMDNWELKSTGQFSDDWCGYEVAAEFKGGKFIEELDFSGNWEGEGANEGFSIEISNFTWEEFDVNIPYFEVEGQHFVKATDIDGQYSISIYGDTFFTDNNGAYICFYPQPDYTLIMYEQKGRSMWNVKVTDKLPELE